MHVDRAHAAYTTGVVPYHVNGGPRPRQSWTIVVPVGSQIVGNPRYIQSWITCYVRCHLLPGCSFFQTEKVGLTQGVCRLFSRKPCYRFKKAPHVTASGALPCTPSKKIHHCTVKPNPCRRVLRCRNMPGFLKGGDDSLGKCRVRISLLHKRTYVGIVETPRLRAKKIAPSYFVARSYFHLLRAKIP